MDGEGRKRKRTIKSKKAKPRVRPPRIGNKNQLIQIINKLEMNRRGLKEPRARASKKIDARVLSKIEQERERKTPANIISVSSSGAQPGYSQGQPQTIYVQAPTGNPVAPSHAPVAQPVAPSPAPVQKAAPPVPTKTAKSGKPRRETDESKRKPDWELPFNFVAPTSSGLPRTVHVPQPVPFSPSPSVTTMPSPAPSTARLPMIQEEPQAQPQAPPQAQPQYQIQPIPVPQLEGIRMIKPADVDFFTFQYFRANPFLPRNRDTFDMLRDRLQQDFARQGVNVDESVAMDVEEESRMIEDVLREPVLMIEDRRESADAVIRRRFGSGSAMQDRIRQLREENERVNRETAANQAFVDARAERLREENRIEREAKLAQEKAAKEAHRAEEERRSRETQAQAQAQAETAPEQAGPAAPQSNQVARQAHAERMLAQTLLEAQRHKEEAQRLQAQQQAREMLLIGSAQDVTVVPSVNAPRVAVDPSEASTRNSQASKRRALGNELPTNSVVMDRSANQRLPHVVSENRIPGGLEPFMLPALPAPESQAQPLLALPAPTIEDEQDGLGRQRLTDLSETQINDLMSKYKKNGYIGTFAADEWDRILNDPLVHRKFETICWIMNTDPRNKPGAHWQAFLINLQNNKLGGPSAEFFDSFGRQIPRQALVEFKKVIEKLEPKVMLKMKVNRVKLQRDDTGSCGAMCCKYLKDRLSGIPFKVATGFNIADAERQAQDQAGGNPKLAIYRFGYI